MLLMPCKRFWWALMGRTFVCSCIITRVACYWPKRFIECVELVDDYSMRYAYTNTGWTELTSLRGVLAMSAINKAGSSSKHYPVKDSLFFKIQGSEESIKMTSKIVQSIVRKHGSSNFTYASTDEEAESLWENRKYALTSTIASEPGSRAWTTDVWWGDLRFIFVRGLYSHQVDLSVPVSKLPHLVYETKRDIQNSGLKAGIVGHEGDGE